MDNREWLMVVGNPLHLHRAALTPKTFDNLRAVLRIIEHNWVNGAPPEVSTVFAKVHQNEALPKYQWVRITHMLTHVAEQPDILPQTRMLLQELICQLQENLVLVEGSDDVGVDGRVDS